MKRIIIIGAGAAGVYLSILLKQRLKEKGEVIVLEQNALPGFRHLLIHIISY